MRDLCLTKLLSDTMKNKAITRKSLVEKVGYKNINKGLRSLDKLLHEGTYQKDFLEKIATVLEVDELHLAKAVHSDETDKKEELELREREVFEPYIYIKAEKNIPSQITIFALTGGVRRYKMISLHSYDEDTDQAVTSEQIQKIIKQHYRESGGIAPFFGKITGYLYCPTYDESYDCTIEGICSDINLGHFRLPIASVRVG